MALWAYWSSHEYFAEGRRWLRQAVAMPGEVPAHLRISAVHHLGNLALTLFDLEEAERHYLEARDLWNETEATDEDVVSELGLGAVTRYQGRYSNSETHYLRVRTAWSTSLDPSDMAIIEHGLGAMYAEAGKVELSRARHREALRLRRQVGEPYGLAYTLVSAAVAERWAGDRAASAAYASEARLDFQELEDPDAELLAILVLARLAFDSSRDSEAIGLLHETFTLLQSNPIAKAVIESLETLSGLLMRKHASTPAAMLLASASAHRTSRSLVIPIPERSVVSELRAAIAEDLGVAAFSAAWSAGLRLSLEQAIDEALHVIANPSQSTTARTRYELTRREVEVLSLLTEHLSDREIADRLFLSPRTIERHVSNILLKMEAPNRRLAAAQAVRERLVSTSP
jgi:DNA-binding NarL/FixJ family response regulator